MHLRRGRMSEVPAGLLSVERGPGRVATESVPFVAVQLADALAIDVSLHCQRVEDRSRVDVVPFVDLSPLSATRAVGEALVLLRLRCWKQAPAVDFQEVRKPSVKAWMALVRENPTPLVVHRGGSAW